jgi:dTDP-4-amino-4,6-dideoxygalactose transaminase
MTSRPNTIPFNRPAIVGKELFYISQAIHNGAAAGDAEFTLKCHSFLEHLLNVPRVLLTASCTHALEMAALLLRVRPGDEVIVPSFTFVSTANAFALHGAKPVFADIRTDTLNIDETQLEQLITPRTKAIVVVHYAGVACEMGAICAIGKRHNIPIVEDNAHGLFGRYRGRYLGTFGTFATQSFHETKNVTCGEGGALVINEVDYVPRAEVIREKGTNRKQFFRGEVDKYTWVDFGSSYLPADLLAAFLYAQLEAWEDTQRRRQRIWERYDSDLADWADTRGIRRPCVPPECSQAFHMYYLLLPSLHVRQRMITHLQSHGIHSTFHYQPLHLSTMGRHYGGRLGACPISESISDRLLRLPFYRELSEDDLHRITTAVKSFQRSGAFSTTVTARTTARNAT